MANYPQRMLVDCCAAIDAFRSSMAMLTNQDYLTEELLESVMFALLSGRLGELAPEITSAFSMQHAVDGEAEQAHTLIQGLIAEIVTLTRPHLPALQAVRYRYQTLDAGLMILERVNDV